MHHRPSVRSSRSSTPRPSPLLPATKLQQDSSPTLCGMPLKYLSLVTLAVQNAALSIVMHYSRVSIPTAQAYSPASAVLLNELLKGSISFFIALARSPALSPENRASTRSRSVFFYWYQAFTELAAEIFSPDCWKLSIPAILYVIQNSLQFVAISNLPVASFQVTYQMKILTTAAFSVALLHKKLTPVKWLSLFFLAIGVGIVQIQSTVRTSPPRSVTAVGSAHEYHVHVMNPLKGFGAVTAACFTSGLAGVYFEMVLKGSKADLWVRNVQLSLFSLIPALLPILYATPPINSQGFFSDLFRNFGGWAWATVAIQVFGGLVTAIVIKYSDNILKGFATSLSIVLSFLASVALFDFRMTPSFLIGASTVLAATFMYNQPTPPAPSTTSSVSSSPNLSGKDPKLSIFLDSSSGKSSPYPTTPVSPDATMLGSFIRRKSSGFGSNYSSHSSSTASLSALLGSGSGPGALGLAESGESPNSPSSLSSSIILVNGNDTGGRNSGENLLTLDTPRYRDAPYGSPFSSKPPSRIPSRAPSPIRR